MKRFCSLALLVLTFPLPAFAASDCDVPPAPWRDEVVIAGVGARSGWVHGRVSEILDAEEKEHGLNQIMRHYSGRAWELPRSGLDRTRVWHVSIESVTGKRSSAE